MKSCLLKIVMVFVLVSVLATASLAQYESSDKSRFGVRFIALHPSDSALKNVNNYWIGPAVDYNLAFDKLDRPSVIISLGWLSESKGYSAGRYVPVTATYIKHYGNDEEKGFYLGTGAGIYYEKFDTYASDLVFNPNTGQMQSTMVPSTGSKNKVGFNVLGGYHFGTWFAELRYDKISELGMSVGSGVDFSGLTFSFGTNVAF